MDTRLQRMMIVLFLVLTLIAVTILFWLPVNDGSDRILVARELEGREKAEEWDSKDELEVAPLDDIIELDTIASNDLSQEEYELSGYVASKNEITEPEEIEQEFVPATQEQNSFAYDVMGNKRMHIADHAVKENDWFSTITGQYWQDLFMWPDLYTMNGNLRSTDPDLIYPGEKVSIYESLVADGEFSEEDRKTLLSAYLKVYKMYKRLGERKDLAAAQLLAAAVRYNKDFLENYSDIIAPEDKKMAETLIKEQQFLD